MFSLLFIAKRHFGYLADERLKPKCPFVTLRSSAILLVAIAIRDKKGEKNGTNK